jgi:hypothetical protein
MNTSTIENKQKTVRAKFNFALMNPKYDSQKALKAAKQEKSHMAYLSQRAVDYAMNDFVFEAGRTYDIPEELYNELSTRTVETYNPLFGSFQGQALELIKRPHIPFVLKVDETGNLYNPHEHKLDLYPPRNPVKVEQNVGTRNTRK